MISPIKTFTFASFIYKLKRSIGLLRIYWNSCDGDWSSIAEIMEYQIGRVSDHIAEHNMIADAPRVIKQMKIAKHCLRRMLDEPYYDIADKWFPNRGKFWVQHIQALERQDMRILLRQLRYLRYWWD